MSRLVGLDAVDFVRARAQVLGGRADEVATTDAEFPNYELYLAERPDAGELVVDRTRLLSAIEERDEEPLRLPIRKAEPKGRR